MARASLNISGSPVLESAMEWLSQDASEKIMTDANFRETCSSFLPPNFKWLCNPTENIFDRRVYKLNQGVINDDQRLVLASFWSEGKDNNKWSTTRGFSIENVKSVLNWRNKVNLGNFKEGEQERGSQSHTHNKTSGQQLTCPHRSNYWNGIQGHSSRLLAIQLLKSLSAGNRCPENCDCFIRS